MRAARSFLPWMVALLAVGTSPAVQAEESDEAPFEVVDPDMVYFGKARHPRSPAQIRADDVWANIPEYRKILEEDLTDEDPAYHILMRKASARFQKALKKVAKRDSRDLIGEVGSIRAKDGYEVPDATDDLIEIVSRS